MIAAKFRWSIVKSWVHQIQGRGTPVLRRVWTMRKSQSGHLRENESRIRAEEGEEHRRAAFLQHTRLIVAESFGICSPHLAAKARGGTPPSLLIFGIVCVCARAARFLLGWFPPAGKWIHTLPRTGRGWVAPCAVDPLVRLRTQTSAWQQC